MIGLNIVLEKNELLYSLNIQQALSNDYILDYFDFDNQSFEDFIDYVDFIGFDEYYFIYISSDKRLSKIVSFLDEKIETKFKKLDLSKIGSLLPKVESELLLNKVSENETNVIINELNTQQMFDNGYKAFKTCYYTGFSKGLLKHVQVDDLESFCNENQNILLHFAINSAIYVNSEYYELKDNPIIVKNIQDFDSIMISRISEQRVIEAISHFITHGDIEINNIITDYGIIMDINKYNSLIYYKEEFYLDNNMKIKIGKKGTSFEKLLNNASKVQHNEDIDNFPEKLIHLFPVLIEISRIYESIKFITPFNSNEFPGITAEEQIKWIGYKKGNQYFVYNLSNGKLYETNESFIRAFERIIKKINLNELPNTEKVEEILNQYEF